MTIDAVRSREAKYQGVCVRNSFTQPIRWILFLLVAGAVTVANVHSATNQPGTLDESFNAGWTPVGIRRVVGAQGKIFIAAEAGIYRLNADSSLDTTFQGGLVSISGFAVYSIAVQPDGRILLCGSFNKVAGFPRSNIARLNSDGTVDPTFSPSANGFVEQIAIQPADGKIVVAGYFDTINGVPRNNVARLDPSGALDSTFMDTQSGPDDEVRSLVIQTDGKIVIGGAFREVNDQLSQNVARLNGNGDLDPTFTAPVLNSYGEALALTSSGKLIFGGQNRLVRLNFDGSVDRTFTAEAPANPPNSGFVYALHIQADQRILVGGTFATAGGQPRNILARYNADGSLDTTFMANAMSGESGEFDTIYGITTLADGKIIVGGDFLSIRGVARGYLARLDASGNFDPGFPAEGPGLVGAVYTLGLQSDGRIVAGGRFTSQGTVGATNLISLAPNGSRDPGFVGATVGDDLYSSIVNSLVVQSNGAVVIGGDFTKVNGASRYRVARLNQNGSLDTTYLNGVSGANDTVWSMALQPDGKVIAAGSFTNFNGIRRNAIVRLNTSGGIDAGFTPDTGEERIRVVLREMDGRSLIGGHFYYCPLPGCRHSVSQIDAAGLTTFGSFRYVLWDGDIRGFSEQPNGQLFIVGSYLYPTNFDMPPDSLGAVRYSPEGVPDTGFATIRANGGVFCVAAQPDGRVILGGDFADINGVPTPGLARLNYDGSLDTNFSAGLMAIGKDGSAVNVILLQGDGKILIGGHFDSVSGRVRNNIARINGVETYAIGQSVTAPPTAPFTNNQTGPVRFEPPGAGCWNPTERRAYFISPGLVKIIWRGTPFNEFAVPYLVDDIPETRHVMGQEIPLPPGVVAVSQPATGPDIVPINGSAGPGAYWHNLRRKLYAVSPGDFTIFWNGSNACPRLPARIHIDWPTNESLFQIHVAGSSAVPLASGTGSPVAALLGQDLSAQATIEALPPFGFTATGTGRCLALLSPGNPQETNIYFQFIRIVSWFDPAYLTDHVSAPIGSPIVPSNGWHNLTYGGPYVWNALSRYCAASNYYNRATRTGPIIPVNRDRTNTTADDMVVVYYEQGTKLYDPLSGQLTNSNIGWPYKPVRYDCQWPANPDKIIIAQQNGGSLQGLDHPALYVQNDIAQPGFNPNEEHALFFNAQGQAGEMELFINRSRVQVAEGSLATVATTNNDLPVAVISNHVFVTAGGAAQVQISIYSPDPSKKYPEEPIHLSVSRQAGGGSNVWASFSPSELVTEAAIAVQGWETARTTLYFGALPDGDGLSSSNLFQVRASGGLVDQKQIVVEERDTNQLRLVVEATRFFVEQGASTNFQIWLTRPPPSQVNVVVAREIGDTDLAVQTPMPLVFNAGNWNIPQAVYFGAAPDGDSANGEAIFTITASGGLAETVRVTAVEWDRDLPSQAVFALRDDLGDPSGTATPQYSEPYVLVMHGSTNNPAIKVYRVVAEEGAYTFNYPGVAGRLIQPFYPLSQFEGWHTNSYATNSPAAWRDRRLFWWARSGPDDGGPGTTNILMRFFYPQVKADWWFPPGTAPVGTAIPFLDRRPGGTPGIPANVTNRIRWPDDVAQLRIGESLVKAKFGLPTIRGQTSTDIIYEQTQVSGLGSNSSARVIDIGELQGTEYSTPLPKLPDSLDGGKTRDLQNNVFFAGLPPHLRSRIWWDDDQHKLKLKGQFVPEFGTEEPVGYLLLNTLSAEDFNALTRINNDPVDPFYGAFRDAINELHSQAAAVRPATINSLPDNLALTAGLARGEGFVTVAFNNVVKPPNLTASRGSPVSLEIIRVSCPLYRGEVKVIYSPDPFDENVTLRHSGDFAGVADNYVFHWQAHQSGGPKPGPDSSGWIDLVSPPAGIGAVSVVVGGSGAKVLPDWWYRCQWSNANAAVSCVRTSAWTEPALVEGWSKRVLGRINFYSQFETNLINTAVDLVANTISKAGSRWVGSVPLNVEAIREMGLVEIYETIFQRGVKLSIEGNPPQGDVAISRSLLLVAAQLANIYLLLGNEAYADAADPTIGFVTTGIGAGQYGVEASSVHCFMDQAGIDSLLAEELALLRGLDDRRDANGATQRVVTAHPIYNRLPPNIGSGFQAQAAYVLNYDLSQRPPSDALKVWPQGHGDAWGHYVMAIKNFYRLLRSTNFTWTVTEEHVRLAGTSADVPVNYQHERKFAEVAAAKARTGAEIVNLTYRSQYVDTNDQWQGYVDSDKNRAWGLFEWASRAGQGAYFDWVTGNALLPPVATDGNQIKVDRTTVTELREVAAGFVSIQDELDKADAGLNPLGLAKNVIPFDIDPAKVDAGETHFEQIYDRARKAMNNAIGVFNHANASTQKLREQADNVTDFRNTVSERENDFTNRLIEVFGYPYAVDPAYAGNPNAPDLFHYMYSDYSDITGEVPPEPIAFPVNMVDTVVSPEGNLNQVTTVVTYHAAPNGFGLVKPSTWGQRRAPGEMQMAHSELLQATGRFKRALKEYENLLAQIEDQATLLQAQYQINAEAIAVMQAGLTTQDNLNAAIRRSRNRQLDFQTKARLATIVANAVAEGFPSSLIFGFSSGGDLTAPIRSAIMLAGTVTTEIMTQNGNSESLVELDHQQAKESAQALQNITLTTQSHELGALQQVAQLEQLVRQEALLRLEIYNQQEAMQQSAGRYASTLARGERLLEERLRFRQQTASRVQDYRYKDMAFRIFRNEALQQYRAQFDLAARYVYLAAAAYDYETNLRDTETRWKPGSSLLTDIVRARSIGVIDSSGNPQPGPGEGRRGDGGLAASLWAMGYNWNDPSRNLKGQLGFNNPARENLIFSLRTGLFRALTNDLGDASWRAWLTSCRVANVAEVPEFVRYCKPPNEFGLGGRKEPGLVIPFTSAIKYRHNFFGWPDTRGSANFSSSYFATKIKSVSVQFDGYDSVNLSTTPYVYVIPVGNDVMLAPITTGLAIGGIL